GVGGGGGGGGGWGDEADGGGDRLHLGARRARLLQAREDPRAVLRVDGGAARACARRLRVPRGLSRRPRSAAATAIDTLLASVPSRRVVDRVDGERAEGRSGRHLSCCGR